MSDEIVPYVNFENFTSTKTPVNSTNLNKIQTDIKKDFIEEENKRTVQVNKLQQKLSNATGKVAWQNSEPSEKFESQTIDLEDDDYDFYEIISTTTFLEAKTISSGLIPKGYGTRLSYSFAGGAGVNVKSRTVNYISGTEILFDEAREASGSNGYSVNNNALVPLYIIIYKKS